MFGQSPGTMGTGIGMAGDMNIPQQIPHGTMGTGIGMMAPQPVQEPIQAPKPQMSVLDIIRKALENPADVADKMARVGMAPKDFQKAIQGNHLGSTMESASSGAKANADSAFGNEKTKSANYLGTYPRAPDGTPIVPQQAPFNSMFAPSDYAQPATGDNFVAQMEPTGGTEMPAMSPKPPTVGTGSSNIMDAILQLFKPGGTMGTGIGALGNNPGTPHLLTGAPSEYTGSGTATPVSSRDYPKPPIAPPVAATGNTIPSTIPPQAATGLTTPTIGQQYGPPQGEFGKVPSGNVGGAQGTAPNLTGNAIYDGFMGAVRQKVTNPYGLAAIAATGKSESGFNAKNALGTWNDVGAPAGGVMSWRADRLKAMQEFVQAHGGDPSKPDPKLQGEFLLQENPGLIDALNNAKSPEEAQRLMNNAWQFKGYQDETGGEAARRIALARNMSSQFAKGENPDIGKSGDASRGGGNNSLVPTSSGDVASFPTPDGAGGGDMSSLIKKLIAMQSIQDLQKNLTNVDMNLPRAPSPVAPSRAAYAPDANAAKLMLSMLYGAGGGANIPSLSQLIGGK